jgi:hypothetical protein
MSMDTNKAAQTVAALAGLYQREVEPDAKQRTAGYWWGAQDEDVGWWLSLCRMVNPDPAQALYIAHVAEDWRIAHGLKEWAYRVAVEFAGSRGSGQRRRAQVEAYRTDWGHQAARDGLALALWPELGTDIPGLGKRAEQFGCGKQGYQRVRDEVMRQAGDLITGFAMDMEQCRTNRFSRDFRERWELAAGREWNHA